MTFRRVLYNTCIVSLILCSLRPDCKLSLILQIQSLLLSECLPAWSWVTIVTWTSQVLVDLLRAHLLGWLDSTKIEGSCAVQNLLWRGWFGSLLLTKKDGLSVCQLIRNVILNIVIGCGNTVWLAATWRDHFLIILVFSNNSWVVLGWVCFRGLGRIASWSANHLRRTYNRRKFVWMRSLVSSRVASLIAIFGRSRLWNHIRVLILWRSGSSCI